MPSTPGVQSNVLPVQLETPSPDEILGPGVNLTTECRIPLVGAVSDTAELLL